MHRIIDDHGDGTASVPNRCRQVAVLVEIDDTWGRNILEAIACFAGQADWQLLIAPRDAQRRLRIPDGWNGDGAIVLLRDDSLLEHLREKKLPAVNISGMFQEDRRMGHVATDDRGRARLAFEHFASRRLSHFAYYCPPLGRYSDQRGEAFRQYIEEQGYTCELLTTESDRGGPAGHSSRQELADRLLSLPKPTGIFAADPYPARQLIEICLSHAIDVPGDVLVLSGDEDELLCNLILPPISSIELASHRIGWEACRMLEGILATGQAPAEPLLVEPLGVCPRRSTDQVVTGDPSVERVLDHIRRHATDRLQIKDLVRVAAMSRRSLEQRFRETLGRSPAEEIRRVRLEKARQMLLKTSLSVSSIAVACGFSSGPYLTHAFRKTYGVVPSDLRIGRKKRAASS